MSKFKIHEAKDIVVTFAISNFFNEENTLCLSLVLYCVLRLKKNYGLQP